MFYLVWIISAFVAVAAGIWVVGKIDKQDQEK